MTKEKSNKLDLNGKNVKERFEIILDPININSDNNLYYRLISFFKLLPLACKNLYGFSLGKAGTRKSKVYELLECNTVVGIPSVASLRGNVNSNETIALLENEFILFEEIAEGAVQTDALGLLKATSTSKRFLKCNENEISYNGSYIMNFNYYKNETSLEDVKKENFKKVLPTIVQDEAFLSRIGFVLIHNDSTVGNPIYKNNGSSSPLELKEYLLSLRKFEADFEKFPKSIFEGIENFTSREQEIILKMLSTILLVLYPEYKKKNNFFEIPNYIVEGFLDIAIHFHSFISGKYKSYLTEKSIKLISELWGYPVLEDNILKILPNDRILLDKKEKIIILATNNHGRNQNEKEFLFFKEKLKVGLTPIESKNNYHLLTYKREHNCILSNKFKIDENNIELRLYKAREMQKEVLNIFKENVYSYIEELFRRNIFYITNDIAQNIYFFLYGVEIFIRSLSRVSYNPFYTIIYDKENIITYFKWCIESICDIERNHNYVLEVKKFLSSYSNLFSLEELKFLDTFSTKLDIDMQEGIICKEIIEINKEKLRKYIGKDINLEDKDYLYYIDKDTLSPKIFIL